MKYYLIAPNIVCNIISKNKDILEHIKDSGTVIIKGG